MTCYSILQFLLFFSQICFTVDKITIIPGFSRQNILIESLFPVNVVDGFLQVTHGLEQGFFFVGKNFLAFGDRFVSSQVSFMEYMVIFLRYSKNFCNDQKSY